MSFGLANWNIRPSTPSQESQFRSFTKDDSASKFSLQKFRTTLQDRAQPLVKPAAERRFTDSNFSTFNSALRNEAVPTFETLERSIRGFSSSRVQEDIVPRLRASVTKGPTYSPKKLSGIKSKIGTIGTISSTSYIRAPSDSFRQSSRKAPQPKPEFKSLLKSGSGLLIDKEPETRSRQRNLADVVPIQQLVEIRTKIESANQSQMGSLTPSYVNELVRLAQVITSSVKRLR